MHSRRSKLSRTKVRLILGLNLMINLMSQKPDKEKRSLLDLNVYKIAEVLLITQKIRLLSKEQLITLRGA